MSAPNLARWYYPPGRPVTEGRVFADPSQAPAGWGVDPTPDAAPAPVAPAAPAVSADDLAFALSTAESAMAQLTQAEARIAELEAQLAAKPRAKMKMSAVDPAAEPAADAE